MAAFGAEFPLGQRWLTGYFAGVAPPDVLGHRVLFFLCLCSPGDVLQIVDARLAFGERA